MAVSGGAGTFIVSSGGDRPIKLGEHQPWSREARVHVWDWSAGDQSRPMKASTPAALAISPDGKWVVTGDGQRIDTATGEATKIDKFPADVPGLAFSPDGGTLVAQVGSYTGPAGKNGSVMWVFDMPAATARTRIAGQWAYTFAATFGPDGGQLFLMDKDKTLRRWDARTGKELGHYEPAFENSIRAIAVSPDAKHVAAAGTQGDLYIWEVAGGKLLHKLSPAGQRLPDLTTLNGMNSLAFSPDGKQLAGGAILATGLWDVETGKLARLLPPHQSGSATFVRFSRDGTKVTTVNEFVGTSGPNGEDLLVYPTVREWDLARDGRAP
jgi:WD40 repeat protein